MAYLLYAGVTGRLTVLRAAGPIGTVLLMVGSALLAGGIAVMWAMLRRAEQ